MSKSFACLDSDCSHHKSRDFILSLTNVYVVGVRWIINQVDGLECGDDLNFLQTPTWVATLVISLSGLSWGFVEISSFFCMYVLNCCFHMNEIISVCKLYWHDPLFGFDDVLKCVSVPILDQLYMWMHGINNQSCGDEGSSCIWVLQSPDCKLIFIVMLVNRWWHTAFWYSRMWWIDQHMFLHRFDMFVCHTDNTQRKSFGGVAVFPRSHWLIQDWIATSALNRTPFPQPSDVPAAAPIEVILLQNFIKRNQFTGL